MSKHKNQRDEIDRWLLDLNEKVASAEELDRFNALLLADPELRLMSSGDYSMRS